MQCDLQIHSQVELAPTLIPSPSWVRPLWANNQLRKCQIWIQISKSTISMGCIYVCHIKISQTITPLATLLVVLESPWLIGVRNVGFIMFQPILKKLLNIEFFFKSFKSKPKFITKFGCTLGGYLKSPWWIRFNEGYLEMFRTKVWDTLNFIKKFIENLIKLQN